MTAALEHFADRILADREADPKPCSTRVNGATGGWCLLPPDHEGPHRGIADGESTGELADGTNATRLAHARCDLCGQYVRRTNGHLALHYATLVDLRPCPRSWPKAPRETGGSK